MNKKKLGFIAVAVLGVSILFTAFTRDEKLFQIDKNLDIYYTLIRELNTFYVDEINPNDLVKSSIDKMLESLDPYTTYIPESEMEDFRFMTTGEYAGIGALIGKQGSHVIISEPYEGFPAQKAGLKAGDILLEVAGKATDKMSTEDVSSLLKGPAKQIVKVKVERPGEKKPFDVDIVREQIQIDAVPYYGMLDDKTGYIRLSNFTANCGDEVRKLVVELKEKQKAQSLILDLRSNPGGLLNEAVKIVNIFVPKGVEVVSTKGKIKQGDKVYYATEQPVDTLMPLVVLVNRGSASASEIVSGALQDLDRAIVIGNRTFGKGLVQTTRDLSYNTKLKVTTAKYYIPSGRCIQALDYAHRNDDGSVGVVPDSLISEFNTRKGRKVSDGGGVTPDVKIELDQLSSLTIELVQQYMIFDFATRYAFQTPAIAGPEAFVLSDDIYGQFKAFLKEKNFSYESETEKALDEMIKTAKDEKYYESAKAEFEALRTGVGHDLDKDLNTFRTEIAEMLTDEIVSRYYYQKGAIRASLKSDRGIEKAKEVLHSPDTMQALFMPGVVIAKNN
ncbi:MAG: S41 family peptidase [Mangrovibacterium sp.]